MPASYSLGLIGFPLGHSISPTLHQVALAQAGLKGEYNLYPIPPLPDGQSALSDLLNRLRSGELQGLNVTIPHKQSVLPFLDQLTAPAAAIGASNTLYMDSGRLIGDNTDAPGFLADLARLPIYNDRNALVLGAGGAARAVVYALLSRGWRISITDVRPQQAIDLHDHFSRQSLNGSHLSVLEFTPGAIQQASREVSLIVNATPVGMHPQVEDCPWPEILELPRQACLYDLIYNPANTRLMQLAAAAGLPCRNGLGMLVEQAALAFERWTGFRPSRSLMLKGVTE